MPKIFALTLKELTIIVRDRTALLLMLAAPLALTFVLNFALGGLGGGLAQISVVIVNEDDGDLGQALSDLLTSDDLSDLLAPVMVEGPDEARARVDGDEAAAAVLIPAGMTEQVTGSPTSPNVGRGQDAFASDSGGRDPAQIIVYVNPGRPISAGVVRGIVERFAQQVAAGAVGAEVTVTQLIVSGRMDPDQVEQAAPAIGRRVALASVERQLITLREAQADGGDTGGFDALSYYAPSMAILFLMFTMISSARTFLTERDAGTLARLRTTPTREGELLGGKIMGIFTTGLLQMAVLILATRLIMGVDWGEPLAVAVLVSLVVAATAATGLVIAALARTASQANVLGSSVVMVLAGVGGSFIPRQAYPAWLQTVGLIGPNAWGIEGFQKLASGAGLGELTAEIAALLVLATTFFVVAMVASRRTFR